MRMMVNYGRSSWLLVVYLFLYNWAFLLNVDWFQPFKHQTYSVAVMYLWVMNLPRHIRFKRENIVLLGLIPGTTEPSLTYLTPNVSDLLRLWGGVNFNTYDHGHQTIRGALLCHLWSSCCKESVWLFKPFSKSGVLMLLQLWYWYAWPPRLLWIWSWLMRISI